jgi:hypothetical protein
MQAQNTPVNRPRKEVSTSDMEVGQRPPVDLDNRESSIEMVEGRIESKRMDDLAFMEEPLTISIQKGSEKYAANMVQCAIEGRGAEQFINGKWVSFGWLPVNRPVITKRKYVEVLARAKSDTVETKVQKFEDHEDNRAIINTSGKYPLSVIRDANPIGYEWLTRVLMEY